MVKAGVKARLGSRGPGAKAKGYRTMQVNPASAQALAQFWPVDCVYCIRIVYEGRSN